VVRSGIVMEDQGYINELNRELKKTYSERDSAKRHVRRTNMEIAWLLNEMKVQDSQPPVRMSNDELAYTIALFLKELKSTKMAFENCALMFKKHFSWSKKIVTYRPFFGQLERAFKQLEKESNYEFLLIRKYDILNKSELEKLPTLSSVMTKLKSSFKLAKKLHDRDVNIETLKEQLTKKNCEIKSLQKNLGKSLYLNQKERVIEIKRQFPQKNYSEIANLAQLSRQTVKKYLTQS
jgi:DNA-binding CsgD family transcriptional regulator